MKKILCLLLASLMVVFALASCGEEDEKKGNKGKNRTSAQKIEDIEKFVDENKETMAALGYKLEARGTNVAIIYTLSEEEYPADYSGELSDALKLETIDGKEAESMLKAIKTLYGKNGKDIKGFVFEYRAPDGTVLATEMAD